MKIHEAFDSDYLNGDGIGEGEVTYTVSSIEVKEFENDKGEKKQKPILRFNEIKQGVVLNKTNFKAMIGITGKPDSDDWKGAKVKLSAPYQVVAGEKRRVILVEKP